MTVRVNKDSLNLREKLSELERPIGFKGAELMKSETAQEAGAFLGVGRKNMIINGSMAVSQRNGTSNSANFSSSGVWIVDRFRGYNSNGVVRGAQSTDSPPGFAYSLKVDVTTADTPRSSSGWSGIYYVVEGYDAARLNWHDPSNAKPCTLSFWIKSSVPGKYTVCFRDASFGYHYIIPYIIESPNTWEYKTITCPPPLLGTYSVGNANGFSIFFGFDIKDTSVLSDDNEWLGNNRIGSGGMAHFFSAVGNALYLSGLQLEVGKSATEFEHRSYSEELSLCQRYYWQTDGVVNCTGYGNTPQTYQTVDLSCPSTMRATPTVTFSDTSYGTSFSAGSTCPQIATMYAQTNAVASPRGRIYASAEL